jgi:predicted P-loop ATPase
LVIVSGRGAVIGHRTPNKDAGFIVDANDTILKSLPHNIKHAIGLLGISLRLNEFSAETDIGGLSGFGTTLTDAAAVRLRLQIEETFDFLPPKLLYEDIIIDIAHSNRFHPVRDWLASLKWDGMPRIDNWLITYAGAKDTPLNRAIGRIFLIAAVRRVRCPGCKFDTMPVFESSQGLNKSMALRTLAFRPEWFTDNLPLNADSKEVIEQTRGVWIAEFAELSGIGKRDIDHVKSFLSRQDDRARPAYGRRSERVPRQYIAAGTTNDDVYLLDTENRRFWPVKIKTFDTEALKRDVEQLWAEAAYYEAQGEPITLQQDLWRDAAEEQAARQIENPYLSMLEERFANHQGWIKSTAVWEALGIPFERRKAASRDVGHAMRALGFERRQIRGGGSRGARIYERARDHES